MPPKKVIGRANRGGRRPNRGRGGNSAPRTHHHEPHHEPQEEMEVDPTTPAPSSPEPAATPVGSQNDAMDVDPNSSPATQPTETPAPTPIRPPQPPILPAQSSASGTAPKKVSKFKPRNVRRTEDERNAAKEAEEARKRGINKEAIAQQRRETAFMRKVGRGGRMGERTITTGVASGPFAEAPEPDKRPGAANHRPKGGQSRGGGGGGGTGSGGGGGGGSSSTTRVKTEGISYVRTGTTSSGRRAKADDDEYSEPEYPDDDNTPRVNIEDLGGISGDEDYDEEPIITGSRHIRGKAKQSYDSNHGGLKPVRLMRIEHKPRESQVNTDSTIKVKNDGKDDDTIMVDETRSTAVGAHDPGVRIKTEPIDEESSAPPVRDFKHPPNIDAIMNEFKNPVDNSEVEKAVINGEVEKAILNDEAKAPSSPPLARKNKPRARSKKENKLVIQTKEDEEEYNRHVEDVRILQDELGRMLSEPLPASQNAEGNVQMDDETEGKKGGRIYLFQFPPVLPKLYDPENQEKPPLPQSKSVQVKKEQDEDIEMTGSSSKKTVDLTKSREEAEDDKDVVLTEEELKAKESRKDREHYVDQEGYVGKLIVRKSGRVELDWGGTRMLIGKGMTTNFFTSGVILDSLKPEEERESEESMFGGGNRGPREGKAMSMGEIMGKFVVTPDWENMM